MGTLRYLEDMVCPKELAGYSQGYIMACSSGENRRLGGTFSGRQLRAIPTSMQLGGCRRIPFRVCYSGRYPSTGDFGGWYTSGADLVWGGTGVFVNSVGQSEPS